MTAHGSDSLWASGDAYEPYVGRWSRLVARSFLAWIAVEPSRRWLDVGCGTAVLSRSILEHCAPRHVVGLDLSHSYIAYARRNTADARARFSIGDACALPSKNAAFDVAVSGLVLNFVGQPTEAVREMARAVREGGTVAAYVWDYNDGMEMIRLLWEAILRLSPDADEYVEAQRYPLCHPRPLHQIFHDAGLHEVAVRPIDVPTVFRDFDDFWTPVLGGQGPAPTFVKSLDEQQRRALRDDLRATLPVQPDGSIQLTARAWAVRGAR